MFLTILSVLLQTVPVRATEEDEQLLALEDYNCLAVVSGQTFNADGIQFEYTQSRRQPDYFSFHDTAIRKKKELPL